MYLSSFAKFNITLLLKWTAINHLQKYFKAGHIATYLLSGIFCLFFGNHHKHTGWIRKKLIIFISLKWYKSINFIWLLKCLVAVILKVAYKNNTVLIHMCYFSGFDLTPNRGQRLYPLMPFVNGNNQERSWQRRQFLILWSPRVPYILLHYSLFCFTLTRWQVRISRRILKSC